MEVEFDVKMTRSVIQDYLLHNGYSSLLWMIVTVMGCLMMGSYFVTGGIGTAFIGLVVVLYMPVLSFFRAGKIARQERFQDRSFFLLNEKGITKVDGSQTKRIDWDEISKVISTRKSIIVFTREQKACIFPRADMGDKTAAVIEIISVHVEPDKVKIRA